MIKKSNFTKALVVIGALMSAPAFATIYDFDADEIERAGDSLMFGTSNELTVWGAASETDDPKDVTNGVGVSYLDAGDYSGLGVCSTAGGLCAGIDDDNMSGTEYLLFEHLTDSFTSMTVNGSHVPYPGQGVYIDADGLAGGFTWVFAAVNSGVVDLAALSVGSTFLVTVNPDIAAAAQCDCAPLTSEAYIGSVTTVPIPAAAWLFGSALIGLAGIARKRKMS